MLLFTLDSLDGNIQVNCNGTRDFIFNGDDLNFVLLYPGRHSVE